MQPDNLGHLIYPPSTTVISAFSVSSFKDKIKDIKFQVGSKLNSIEEKTFESCANLVSVDFSNCLDLETLNEYVFFNCTSLSEVILPENGKLKTICGGCFMYTKIEKIKFPQSLQDLLKASDANRGVFTSSSLSKIEFYSDNNLVTVARYTFSGCSLTEFEVGPMLTSFTGVVFEGHKQTLKKITVKGTNSKFFEYENALYSGTTLIYCPNAIENPKIWPQCTTLGDECFTDSVMRECLFLPDSLTSIINYAFIACSNLIRVVIPSKVNSIQICAFYGCRKLTYIVLPEITEISSYLFWGCSSLKSVTIPNSVTIINAYAFQNCHSLSFIAIPDSVTTISSNAFQGSGLESCGIACTAAMKEKITSSTNLKDSSFEMCRVSLTINCGKKLTVSPYLLITFIS